MILIETGVIESVNSIQNITVLVALWLIWNRVLSTFVPSLRTILLSFKNFSMSSSLSGLQMGSLGCNLKGQQENLKIHQIWIKDDS